MIVNSSISRPGGAATSRHFYAYDITSSCRELEYFTLLPMQGLLPSYLTLGEEGGTRVRGGGPRHR